MIYEDARWSFNLEVFFSIAVKSIIGILWHRASDRADHEDAHIFAPNLHEMGLMSKRDYNNYFQFFQTLKRMVQPPDLLIYLHASVPTLVGQIQKRGREYEENIRLDYLKRLNDLYNKWIESYKEGALLVVDIDKNKFPENEEHLGEIIRKIDAQLYGLF
jgi:deoxyadenosine/deoxycytidine kinase